MTAAAVAVAFTLAQAAAGHRTPTPAKPPWLPQIFWNIAVCETRANWKHSTRDYVSIFGIFRGTWAAYRPAWVPRVPERASPKQQYAVAVAIRRRHGYGAWGCYNRYAWVRGQ